MPQTNNIVFSYKEIAEALVRKSDIHEGLWGIYIEFGLNASNIAFTGGELTPSAVVAVSKIGIQRFDKPSNLTIDAAEINPIKETEEKN